MCRLALRGSVLIQASQITWTLARGARQRSMGWSCLYKYMSSKSKSKHIVLYHLYLDKMWPRVQSCIKLWFDDGILEIWILGKVIVFCSQGMDCKQTPWNCEFATSCNETKRPNQHAHDSCNNDSCNNLIWLLTSDIKQPTPLKPTQSTCTRQHATTVCKGRRMAGGF